MTAWRQGDQGSGAEMESEVVPSEVKRGQITQGLIQTMLRFLDFIPRAVGRN